MSHHLNFICSFWQNLLLFFSAAYIRALSDDAVNLKKIFLNLPDRVWTRIAQIIVVFFLFELIELKINYSFDIQRR